MTENQNFHECECGNKLPLPTSKPDWPDIIRSVQLRCPIPDCGKDYFYNFETGEITDKWPVNPKPR